MVELMHELCMERGVFGSPPPAVISRVPYILGSD